MKYGKQFRKILAGGEDKTAMVGVALIGGLAIGAALAVIFAPKKGKELRKGISDAGKGFTGTLSELMDSLKAKFGGEEVEDEIPQHEEKSANTGAPVKRPKSDIKSILHEAHKEQHNITQQN